MTETTEERRGGLNGLMKILAILSCILLVAPDILLFSMTALLDRDAMSYISFDLDFIHIVRYITVIAALFLCFYLSFQKVREKLHYTGRVDVTVFALCVVLSAIPVVTLIIGVALNIFNSFIWAALSLFVASFATRCIFSLYVLLRIRKHGSSKYANLCSWLILGQAAILALM